MSLPVCTGDFWRQRLLESMAEGWQLHTAIYRCDPAVWMQMELVHRQILADLIHPYWRILDAGCGYGALYDIMPWQEGQRLPVDYRGVDLSEDLIRIARIRHPWAQECFSVGDLRNLEFEDNRFELVICRSISSMIRSNLGDDAWRIMEHELFRVGQKLLILHYEQPEDYALLDAPGQSLELPIRSA